MSVDPPVGRRGRPTGTRTRRRWIRALVVAAAVVAAGYALRGGLPRPAELVATLRSARDGWLALAAMAEAGSIAMFARQQRRLLTAFGVSVSLRRSLALAYARSAISVIAPAGAALSAGYAFRQFRARGASPPVAMAATAVCGVLSLAGLVLLVAVGAVPLTAVGGVRYPAGAAWLAVAAAGAGAAVVGGVVARAHRRRWPYPAALRRRTSAVAAMIQRRTSAVVAALAPVRGALTAVAALPRRDWLAALAYASASWLCDLVCLLAAAYAFALPLTAGQLAAGYLAVQVVRQLPATPGGVGVVEASLLIMLVSAGAPRAPAAAAVLVYRLLSCWAVLPVGLAAWAALRPAPGTAGGRREAGAVAR